MARVQAGYVVSGVDVAITCYWGQLVFVEVTHPAPAFAVLSHGDLRLF